MSVTELCSMTGLEAEEQTTAQLRASRIINYSQQKDVLIKEITESCDPFSPTVTSSNCLPNIATGKAASKETEEYLTQSLIVGRNLRVKFQEECVADEQRFLKSIKRRKVCNFPMENAKGKHPGTKRESKVESLKDIFIRILVIISKQTNFNLRHVVSGI